MHFRHLVPAALIVAAASPLAGAVELGDPVTRSHIGQPLSADIELTGLASDNAVVQAGVSSADVYRGASTAMHPALAGAAITTFRRDGRRYLHLASPVAVRGDHVVVFLTLTENGQTAVRQTTLWLTPDPNPAPQPVPVAAMEPAPVAAPVPVPAPVPPAAPVALAVPAPAPKRTAFIPAPAAVRHPVTLPRSSAAPVCASGPVQLDATCVALDAKNAALTAHLAELEGKIKQLNVALQGGAGQAAPAVAPAVVHAVAPAPAPKPLPAKLVPMGSTPAAPSGGRPWMVIGITAAIILALAGGLGVVLLRQRRKTRLKRKASELIAAAAAERPSFIDQVKKRLMPGRAAPAIKTEALEEAEVENTVPAL